MKITFKKDYACEVVTRMLDDDTPETECDVLKKGQTFDVDITEDKGKNVDVQFGDGSMVFNIPKSCFTATE